MDFTTCNPQSSVKDLHPVLVALLEDIEQEVGFELIINSAFRSVSYEKRMGRNGTSAHCQAMAVDIHCMVNHVRFKIISAAIKHNVTRIGIGKNFIHLDIAGVYGKNKTNNICWLY